MAKRTARLGFTRLGIDVRRADSRRPVSNPVAAAARFISRPDPLIYDVGANIGQSLRTCKDVFPRAQIHSFEPSASSFARLAQAAAAYDDVYVNQTAVGSTVGSLPLHVNDRSDMSSLLTPSEACWGRVVASRDVPLTTLDVYSAGRKLQYLHLLKTDTQGYELNVLQGAESLFSQGRVGAVLTELIFSDMYEGSARADQILEFLFDYGLRLVSFYDLEHRRGVAGWCDALFVQRASIVG